jgi:hypothetical protein
MTTPATTRDLAECFDLFEATTHRTETLPAYNVPAEAEALSAFRDGLPLPERSVRTNPHLARIQRTTLAGKTWSRIRIIGWPLTEYQRFQFAYGYPPSADAGEVISVASLAEHPELAGLFDAWLFDAERSRPFAAVMSYSEGGAWLGCEVTNDPDVISRCMKQKQLAERYAVPLGVFLSRHGA